MTIQKNLKWNKHCDKVLKKLRTSCATIFAVRNIIGKHLLKTIYFSLFESHIRYGLLSYGAAGITVLEQILILQKKSIRTINKVGYRHPTTELFKRDNILNIFSLYIYRLFEYYVKHQYLFIDDVERSHATRASVYNFRLLPLIKYKSSEGSVYYKILKFIHGNSNLQMFFKNEPSKCVVDAVTNHLLNLKVEEVKNMLTI